MRAREAVAALGDKDVEALPGRVVGDEAEVAAPSGLLLPPNRVAEREEDDDGGDADADRGVGDVERGPMRPLDEVGDFADANAVAEVADGAAELKAEGDSQDAVVHRRVEVVEQDGEQPEEGRRGEEERLALEHAEGGAAVGVVHDANEAAFGDGLADAQVGAHEVLRHLVEGEDGAATRKNRLSLRSRGQRRPWPLDAGLSVSIMCLPWAVTHVKGSECLLRS